MSSELQVVYPVASSTLYAVIRRASDSYVWNGSTWETWANGSIATYDVALTDQGGDLYTADFPSSIAAANYRITFYLQAGGTPAITDTIIGGYQKQWDGAGLTDPGDATLDQYALTTLTKQKRFMGLSSVTTYDQLLTELINALSDKIERLAGRKFKARDYRDWHDPEGGTKLQLKQFPVITINRVSYGANEALNLTYSGSAIRATVQVTDTLVRLRSVASGGTATTSDLTFATYDTASELVTAIDAVSGWNATLTTDVPSADLRPMPGRSAKSETVSLVYPDEDMDGYTIDLDAGLMAFADDWPRQLWSSYRDGITQPNYGSGNLHAGSVVGRFPSSHRSVLVEYNAGYETIPDDIDLVCRQLVKAAFDISRKDTSVQSESLGDYSYTLADRLAITDEQSNMIYSCGGRLPLGVG